MSRVVVSSRESVALLMDARAEAFEIGKRLPKLYQKVTGSRFPSCRVPIGRLEGGKPSGLKPIDETQWALWRAGHAHAGVWVILSLVLQVLLDSATLPSSMKWLARLAAPAGAVAVSGGFFGVAFFPGFRWLLYLGALSMFVAVVVAGVGLLRSRRTSTAAAGSQSLFRMD